MLNKLAQIAFVLTLAIGSAVAAPNDIQFSITRLKLDEQKGRAGGTATVQTKQVAYKVTVLNKSFKPIANLDIKYMIFYYDSPELGSKDKAKEVSQKGSEKLEILDANKSTTFETKPVELTSQTLDGGWYFANGASQQQKDRVSAVWFRAYSDGKLVGEYINPTSISQRQEWKD